MLGSSQQRLGGNCVRLVVVTTMMFCFLSRPTSNLGLVRAFSTTSSTIASAGARTTATSRLNRRSKVPDVLVRLQAPQQNSYRLRSTTTATTVASVDEDLDAALDDILGNPYDEDDLLAALSSKPFAEPAVHMERSKPIPKTLVEKVDPVNYEDPKFLSTSNPRWVEAGLSQKVIDILSERGITKFTPVQAEAFDPILAGRDVIGRSRTGTGKTLAFGLPAMTRLLPLLEAKGYRDPRTGAMKRGRPVSMIVMCPTRELARQVQDELIAVSKPMGLFVTVFHGGVSYDPQSRALRDGVDVIVGTPGRVIDHINRGNLKLNECEIAVLDEADEMLNMGFAEDVEVILDGMGSNNDKKSQCLLFSATTPPWVKEIGRSYQKDVLAIDSTTAEGGGARVATTVRHMAIQVPPGPDSKKAILEDIIAVEISKDMKAIGAPKDSSDDEPVNLIAAAAAKKKKATNNAMQQKIFGKTIVFTETKREADELVSGGVFKSLTAQALHGDVGQKQRDATLNAFRAGAFNVLVATDVAARGIDISDVDLVVQFDPPRDVDSYVHRSGRTGRAGRKGVSVLLFNRNQERDIVRIERDLGHGFKFDLSGPPSIEAALKAAAKTSALACSGIPDETSKFFKEAADALLAEEDPSDVVARCLAAISRRSSEVQSRSLISGELGFATVEMSNSKGRPVSPGDVMFTVGKLSRMSRNEGDIVFDSDVGKIQANPDSGVCFFDMGVEDARRLVEFSKTVDAGGNKFSILESLEIERDQYFGRGPPSRGGKFSSRGGPPGRGGPPSSSRGSYQGRSAGAGPYQQARPGGHQDRGRGSNTFQERNGRYESRGAGGSGGSYSGGAGGSGGGGNRERQGSPGGISYRSYSSDSSQGGGSYRGNESRPDSRRSKDGW